MILLKFILLWEVVRFSWIFIHCTTWVEKREVVRIEGFICFLEYYDALFFWNNNNNYYVIVDFSLTDFVFLSTHDLGSSMHWCCSRCVHVPMNIVNSLKYNKRKWDVFLAPVIQCCDVVIMFVSNVTFHLLWFVIHHLLDR